MKEQKLQNMIIIFLFVTFLVMPILCTDFIGGKVSDMENRQLSRNPIFATGESGVIDISRSGVENWISDNIGFRTSFVNTYTTVKNKLFHLSTSSLVLTGKEGWYFFTGDNNIEIATGNYPLDEYDLELIAQYQQSISDYYHSIGKEYILMLTPSKAGIYSEYLPMSDEVVSYTPVDMVADYLKEHTDVVVYNSKPDLLNAKSEGQLFYKTDTHWTELGSYCAYKGLYEVMRQHGIVSGEPIDVSFGKDEYKGEFSAMLGNVNLLPTENTPIALWDQSFYIVTEGAQYTDATAVQQFLNPAFGCTVLQNDTIENGKTLQIYGDSQLGVGKKVPCYFAESFSKVFNYAIRNISTVVDEIADPDVVVYSCSERYIKDLLTQSPQIQITDESISEIPELEITQSDGYSGMWIDNCNNTTVNEQGNIYYSLLNSNHLITFVGWAADFTSWKPLSALYIQIGEHIIQCQYGVPRESVSSYFGRDTLLNTGFIVTVPLKYFTGQHISEIQFIQIATDGTYRYPPVSYSIVYASTTGLTTFIQDTNVISQIPQSNYVQESFYLGMWLDSMNNYGMEEQGKISTELLKGEDSVTLVGWAADFQAMQPLSALYLKIGDRMLQCQYGIARESVSSYLGIDALLHTGFEITFPAAYLTDGAASELQFIQISADGSHQFAPASYTIQR